MKSFQFPRLRKYTTIIHRDLRATYSRDLHKWLIVSPIIGVTTGLLITLIVKIILGWMWPKFLALYIHHPFAMIPALAAGS